MRKAGADLTVEAPAFSFTADVVDPNYAGGGSAGRTSVSSSYGRFAPRVDRAAESLHHEIDNAARHVNLALDVAVIQVSFHIVV